MTTIVGEEPGAGKLFEGISNGQRCQSVDTLAEWRSSDQVENGSPSTSPPYWETDEEEEGAKPCELFGKHTWKIEKFSQINKRELRSSVFEVGGYKWYILIYPQGCDVCNHLSLFLCVANHDKLLPGWSHFAQFTIAVVNKDPKKSKYSDTLHRFWKKEHDWGWKKFMELSKIPDGFIDADTLIIKAQVQVIREKADRPFRCLDCQYRRELVRVYLTNVEQICRRFVEERRNKLGKLIEDKARWSSFCAFWLGMDQSARRCMSRERTDVILKVVVKHFFIEKEVTSTLVMDSLYSGFKALECQFKCKNAVIKMLDSEEILSPIVCIEKDMFVLVDDVLLLLERAAIEPLPPKDDKGPQNRTKDGSLGETMSKDSIERDEKRLTELGRRTVEIFVLAHIFSNKIEVAYQEAVALKRQEELIREEEEAVLAESEKAKRCGNDKDKKSKKKQAKQKRNNRKSKDKARDERAINVNLRHNEDGVDDKPKTETKSALPETEKPVSNEDVSDTSGSVECVIETPRADPEERDPISVNWDTDTSEVHPPDSSSNGLQNGLLERKNQTPMDDSSSTCSTDSVPSVVINGHHNKTRYSYNNKSQKSPRRGRSQQILSDARSPGAMRNQSSGIVVADVGDVVEALGNGKASGAEPNGVQSSPDRAVWLEKNAKKKELNLQQKKPTLPNSRDHDDIQRRSKLKPVVTPPSPGPTIPPPPSRSPPITTPPNPSHPKTTTTTPEPARPKKPPSEKTAPLPTPIHLENPSATQIPTLSRPSSAPLVPALRLHNPVPSTAPNPNPLSRSVSAAGRIGPDGHIPHSYRNAIIGNSVGQPYSRPPLFPPPSDPVPRTLHSERLLSPRVAPDWFATGRKEVGPTHPAAGPSGRQPQVAFADDFPHLDIINDLLDDEHGVGPSEAYFYGRQMNRRFSYHSDTGLSGEAGSSSAPCPVDRKLAFREDGMTAYYGYAGFQEYIPQHTGQIMYPNGHGDGLISAQWPPVHRPDGEMYGGYRNMPADYPGGYPVFRPN